MGERAIFSKNEQNLITEKLYFCAVKIKKQKL
jgi:hypothetical protein